MNKNKIALVFAGIFLVIVLAAPIIFFVEERSAYQTDINNFPNDADETQTSNYLNSVMQKHTTSLAILLTIETVSVILLVIALWFALKTS
jgi:uncharacterized membrane protein SpoIIM required for sporulation